MHGFHRRCFHLKRIHCTSVPVEPEIEVGSRSQPAAAHIPDHIPLLHIHTLSHPFPETAQMHVCGGIHTVVFDLHIVATVCTGVPVGAA